MDIRLTSRVFEMFLLDSFDRGYQKAWERCCLYEMGRVGC